MREDRIVQIDRRSKVIRDADGVRAKFGVNPELIPDYLALVGDAADGYPGIAGIGPKGAAALLTRYGAIERFPPQELGERQRLALLFKVLATLRTDANLFADVNELEWGGPTARFPAAVRAARRPRSACARYESRASPRTLTKLPSRGLKSRKRNFSYSCRV